MTRQLMCRCLSIGKPSLVLSTAVLLQCYMIALLAWDIELNVPRSNLEARAMSPRPVTECKLS